MVAAALRRKLAIESIGVFLAAWLLGTGIAGAAALSIAMLAALHAGLILLTFVLARPRASLGTIAAECAAYFALFALIQPFDRLFMGAAGQSPLLGNTPPVLFVHGYVCNRGLWWWLLRQLRWHGIGAGAVSLEPPLASIDALAAQLHQDIEDLLRVDAGDKLILVTHSMGGLAARAYLKQHGAARVAKLVTLACPHHGTRLAHAGSWPQCARDGTGLGLAGCAGGGRGDPGALRQCVERARQFRRAASVRAAWTAARRSCWRASGICPLRSPGGC